MDTLNSQKSQSVNYGEYIGHTIDIFGDIEEIKVKNVETGKNCYFTSQELIQQIKAGKWKVKYIKVDFSGNIHFTKKNKKTIADKIKELKVEIRKLKKSSSNKDKLARKIALLERLNDEKNKAQKYDPKKF